MHGQDTPPVRRYYQRMTLLGGTACSTDESIISRHNHDDRGRRYATTRYVGVEYAVETDYPKSELRKLSNGNHGPRWEVHRAAQSLLCSSMGALIHTWTAAMSKEDADNTGIAVKSSEQDRRILSSERSSTRMPK